MRNDGLSTVLAVARFLDDDVLAAVPRELAGEVRAAAKLLRTAAVELEVRHRVVDDEISELLALCETTEPGAVAALRQGTTDDLTAQEDLRGAVHELTALVMTRLVRDEDPRLETFLRSLQRHAAGRQPWQAVFPLTEGAR